MPSQSLHRPLAVALISWFHLFKKSIDSEQSISSRKERARGKDDGYLTWNVVGTDVDDDRAWFDPVTLDELGFPDSRNKDIGPSDLNRKRTDAICQNHHYQVQIK